VVTDNGFPIMQLVRIEHPIVAKFDWVAHLQEIGRNYWRTDNGGQRGYRGGEQRTSIDLFRHELLVSDRSLLAIEIVEVRDARPVCVLRAFVKVS